MIASLRSLSSTTAVVVGTSCFAASGSFVRSFARTTSDGYLPGRGFGPAVGIERSFASSGLGGGGGLGGSARGSCNGELSFR